MYVIRNNPETSTQSLFWSGQEVVGIMRAEETLRFANSQEAQAVIDAGKLPGMKLYGWVVATENCTKLPAYDHGWMVRNPGYDLG